METKRECEENSKPRMMVFISTICLDRIRGIYKPFTGIKNSFNKTNCINNQKLHEHFLFIIVIYYA